MAFDRDELNNPRPDSWQRQRRRKQAKLRRYLTFGAVFAVSVLVIVMVLLRANNQPDEPSLSTPPTTVPAPVTTVPTPTQPAQPETVIKLIAGGDINITDKVVASGKTVTGYDYAGVFMDIAPVLAGADAAIINLEGNLVGSPYGTASSSAPQELAKALAGAGVDFIQTANSCAINNGITGLRATMDAIRQTGMEPLGTFATEAEFTAAQGFTIRNIGGIRVAFVALTKGMGGLGLPEGSEHSVNVLYKDYASTYQRIDKEGINALLQAVQAQKPDVTIALLHWGSEYNRVLSTRQETITKLMLQGGVDAIIGTHSHYVQQVSYDRENGTVVAYSLGDLFGNAEKTDTNFSILLELEITRDNTTGQTRITGCSCIPVYTLTPERDGEAMRLVHLETAMAQYENNFIHKVSEKAYNNMKSALAKIKARTGLYE